LKPLSNLNTTGLAKGSHLATKELSESFFSNYKNSKIKRGLTVKYVLKGDGKIVKSRTGAGGFLIVAANFSLN